LIGVLSFVSGAAIAGYLGNRVVKIVESKISG